MGMTFSTGGSFPFTSAGDRGDPVDRGDRVPQTAGGGRDLTRRVLGAGAERCGFNGLKVGYHIYIHLYIYIWMYGYICIYIFIFYMI
jgi:hypothetical protein